MIEEPPSSKVSMDIGAADIPVDDIKGKRRMEIWGRLIKPVLYPAGSAVCTRCSAFHTHF